MQIEKADATAREETGHRHDWLKVVTKAVYQRTDLRAWTRHRAAAAAFATALALSACGGSPSPETDWTEPASRAGVSALTTPAADGSHSLTVDWIDTLDGEQGWRIETLNGSTWDPLATLPASPGVGLGLTWQRSISANTVLRVVALLPDSQAVVLSTPSQQRQLTARTQLPGVAITLAGTDQPLTGDTTIGLGGGAQTLSVQYSAGAIGNGAAGDGLLGTPVSRNAPGFGVPWRSGQLNDGRYRIDAKLEVEAGNFIVIQRAVDVHNSGLKVGVGADVNGQQVNLKLQLESNVAQPSVTVLVDGVVKARQTLASGWQVQDWPLALGELEGGEHEIVVRASDSSGASAETRTTVRVVGALRAALDVPDGAVAFDQLVIGGSGGALGSVSPATLTLRLDGAVLRSTTSGSFTLTLGLAGLADGPHTLTLDVEDTSGRTASVSRRIQVQSVSPQFQRVKAVLSGAMSTSTLTSLAFDGRLALNSTSCPGFGGRVCIDLTTVEPDTPQVQLAFARFIGVRMNADWTWYSASDGASRWQALVAAPDNAVVPNYGRCTAPDASTDCLRWPEDIAVGEWVAVGEVNQAAVVSSRVVLRNMRTGEERALPGRRVTDIPATSLPDGGWQWTVQTSTGYAVYNTTTGTSQPLDVPGTAVDLKSDGRRLVWLSPQDSAAPRRRQLYAATPETAATPQLLADYTITDTSLAETEFTRAGGGWVVWTERDTARNLSHLKANDGNSTRTLASSATLRILTFADGAVAWFDESERTYFWTPNTGVQLIALKVLLPAITRRGLYAVFPDSALYRLSF